MFCNIAICMSSVLPKLEDGVVDLTDRAIFTAYHFEFFGVVIWERIFDFWIRIWSTIGNWKSGWAGTFVTIVFITIVHIRDVLVV